jgi:gamma-carbonic anhydrase
MAPPTLWQNFRQVIGRALRETGQALDRLGVKTVSLAITKHDFYDDPVVYEDHLSRHRHLFPLLASGRPVIHPSVAYLAPCSTLIGSVFVGKNSSIWYGAVLRGDTCENAEAFRTTYSALEAPATEAPQLQAVNATLPLISAENGVESIPTDDAIATAVPDRDVVQDTYPQPWKLRPERFKDQSTHHGGAIFIGDDTNIQDGCIVTARTQHTIIGHGVTIGHLAQLHSCTVHDYALIGMGSVLNAGVVVEREAMVAAGAVVAENTIVPSGELWVGSPARKVRDLTAAQRQKLHYQSSEYVGVARTQRHVMALGGNVDPVTGIAVDIVPVDAVDEDFATAETESLLESSRSVPRIGTTPTKSLHEALPDKDDMTKYAKILDDGQFTARAGR